MLYAIKRTDGGVSIRRLMPFLVFKDEGEGKPAGRFVINNGVVRLPEGFIERQGTVEYPDILDELKKSFVPDEEKGETMADFTLEKIGVLSYQEITEQDIPASRNYRDAWNHDLGIDLEKAKPIQKRLMVEKALERAKDEFGEVPQSVKDEIKAIDVDSAADLTELYNKWPASIERRQGAREYKIRKD